MSKVPAGKVVAAWLVAEGFGTTTGDWKTYSPMMPDDQPDNALAVATTSPVLDGVILKTDEVIAYHGIQVRVRSKPGDHDTGWAKGVDVLEALIALKDETVTVGAKQFLLESFTLTDSLLFIGMDQNRNRPLFTFNGTVQLKEL